jgi:hypothetical protein
MLQRGDLIRHFEVTTLDGHRIDYANVWQRRNLVLITLPASDSDASRSYASELSGARSSTFVQHRRSPTCRLSRTSRIGSRTWRIDAPSAKEK